ncbi:response regulator [bacterium]|nr:response regulator [bacterium]
MGKIRVAVADDHPIVTQGLGSLIEQQDDMLLVSTAGTAEEALTSTLRLEPDLLVLDLGLPNMGGMEVMRRIKEDAPHIRVLVLSVYPESMYAVPCIEAGAGGYCHKDTDPVHILDAIRMVHNGHMVLSESLRSQLLQKKKASRGSVLESLTSREAQVLQLLAEGKRNKEIARLLDISEKTVHTHKTNILEKTRAESFTTLLRRISRESEI